jgi:hypothetical protein
MLTYPIRVDGSRLCRAYGYEYRYSSLQALVAQEGRYASSPEPSARLATDGAPAV